MICVCMSVFILIHTQISVIRKGGESRNIILNTMQCEYMNIYLQLVAIVHYCICSSPYFRDKYINYLCSIALLITYQ